MTVDLKKASSGDADFEAIVALTKQLLAVCSEFDIDHVITGLANTLGRYMTGIKPECRQEILEAFNDFTIQAIIVHESAIIQAEGEANGG